MEQEYDTTFLARWLANELSEEELTKFKASESYKQYAEIVDTVDHAEFPAYDVDKNYQATLDKMKASKEEKKVRKLIPNWAYAVAASILLVIGWSYYFKEATYTTQFAEQTEFKLPDGSKVYLNSGSSVTFKRFGWSEKRELNLEGEAFFKVQKGEKFTVKTEQGSVSVLGTQFTVNARTNYFNVVCYEGKVKVETLKGTEQILTRGNAFSQEKETQKSYKVRDEKPGMLSKESSFYQVSIFRVIEELERQYNVKVEGKEKIQEAYFSGRFKHNNLEKAVQIIFATMGISYEIKGDVIVVKSHK
ncbi:FecR family protein [Wenyingzhuangia sp. IMCC45574]